MKKLLAVLLALVLAFSMTAVAFAEDEGTEDYSFPKPSDVLYDAGARTALKEIHNKYMVTDSYTDEDTGEEVTVSYVDMDDAQWAAELLLHLDYAEQLNDWDEKYGYTTTWSEAWLQYYGIQIVEALGGITEDPTGAITGLFGAIGGIAGDIVEGNIDSDTAATVTGQIGGEVATMVGDLTGKEVDAETTQKIQDTISQIVGTVGGVVAPGEPVETMESEEYAQQIIDMINDGTEVTDITSKIFDDLKAGVISIEQVPEIAQIISDSNAIDPSQNETVQEVLGFLGGIGDVIGGGEGDGFQLPDFGDISLPIDLGGSEGGSFLDTILGIIGSIGDLFGGGSEGGEGGSGSGSGSDSDWGDSWNDDIPDTGDVSFVAVAAVAAVAGAAFVLTRKKSNDAE